VHGDNQIPAQKPSPWWVHLWLCYRNPFNLLLTVLGIISYATEDLFAAGVIALMVGISTLLNFIQEARSTKAADALKAMVSNTATVSRVINDLGENAWVELPIDQLVPGDLVKLARGHDPGGFTHHPGARSVRGAGLADRGIPAR
jgi:Mg2+-importing ATPase